jgi:hypothetical protein
MTDYDGKLIGGRNMVRDQQTGRVRNRRWPWPWDAEGRIKPGCENDALVTRRAGKKAKPGQIVSKPRARSELPSDLRQKLRESAADRIRQLEEIAQDKRVAATDRIKAIETLLRYGLGPAVEVSGPDRGPIEVEARNMNVDAVALVTELQRLSERMEEEVRATEAAAALEAAEKAKADAPKALTAGKHVEAAEEAVEGASSDNGGTVEPPKVPPKRKVIPILDYGVVKPASTFTPPWTTQAVGPDE